MDGLQRALAPKNRVATRRARHDVSLRSDVRRLTQVQAATDRALKTLIETMTHRNGRR